jgi:uncharacterized protein
LTEQRCAYPSRIAWYRTPSTPPSGSWPWASLGDDGLPEPLQFEISVGLRVLLIPSRGFGWVIGGRKRSPRDAHECLVVIGLATDAAVDELMRRAQDAGAKIVIEPGNQKWGYAGAFADPDGHMWQVSRADGFLTR